MSAILAVCGDTFCAMVSDGRYVEEPITGEKPHILKNDLPKVRKINRNVVVGFAGDTLAAVQIINAVDEYQTQYLTLEKVVKILREKAATVSVQPVGVRLIVGGRNRKGVFTMTMMGSVDGYEPQTQAACKSRYLLGATRSPNEALLRSDDEVNTLAANWHSLDDVAHTLDGCIAKMAKLDKSINTTYFRQLVM